MAFNISDSWLTRRLANLELSIEVKVFSWWFIFLACMLPFCMLMPDINTSSETVGQVSGYYGPGFVLAWLTAGFNNFEFTLVLRSLHRWFRGRKALLVNDVYDDLRIDAIFLGTVGYSLVAMIDLFLYVWKSPESETQLHTLYAPIDAQLAVTQLSLAVSVVAINFHGLFLQKLRSEEKDPGFDHEKFARFTTTSRIRITLWTLIFVCSEICLALFDFPLRSGIVWNLKYLGRLMVVCTVPEHVLSAYGCTNLFWRVVCSMIMGGFLGLWHSASTYKDEKLGVRFAFPRSSARLFDLDQAAVFAVSFCTIAAPLMKLLVHLIQRAFTSEAENRRTVMDKPGGHYRKVSIEPNC